MLISIFYPRGHSAYVLPLGFKDRGGESEEDLIDLDIEVIDMARDVNGYFIAYEDLFSASQDCKFP